MKLHHTKHHQTYVNGLNAAEEALAKAQSAKEKISLQPALKFNGGGMSLFSPSMSYLSLMPSIGHINHSLFWENLAPSSGDGGKLADGPLKTAIERDFGSLDAFKKEFNARTAAIQGSGWGWLVSFRPSPCVSLFMGLLGLQYDEQEIGNCHYT